MQVEITFEGTAGGTYTVAENMVQYIGNDLVNHGYNGTIYLYPVDSVSDSRSEYISLSPNQYPRYYSSGSYNYTSITNASNVSFNAYGQYLRNKEVINGGVSFFIMLFIIIRLFKN